MLESIFLAVAEAVFSYVITTLDPVQPIKKWLGREPARLAFQKALSRAYSAFARQYPEYTASLFDQTFLTGAGAPELAKLLTRHLPPDPALFAQAWGTSIGLDAHSPFCREATKPAADFLKWLETELKSETIFQPIFDSRALESLPNLENQLEKLTAELKRGLDAALKTANDYEKIVLDIGGNVSDSNIITGNDNQITVSNIYNHYHTGAFATLSDYYIAPDAVFQRVRVDEFVGRDWLTAKVDAFLNDPDNRSGIFLLIGEAGVGKTSFMAHLVRERRYLHLFAEQAPGDANLRRALQSLGSQLVTRHQIAPYKDRDTLTQLAEFPDFLDKLLRLAANTLAKGEKIVIVCDALDEAGTAPDGNVFGLPNVLPDNVYFILSQRPVSTRLLNVPTRKETLEARGDENLQDMEDYLKALCKRPEIAGQLRAKNYSDEFFVQTLKEKSLGVWMYLHYIIEEISKGSRAPLELENLPTGLVGYYADHWNDWREGRNGRGEGPQKWDELYAPLLTTLAAAQEPVAIEQIMKWSGVRTRKRETLRLLNEHWRSFLTIRKEQGNTLYAPYHASFRDFLTGKVDFTQLRSAENYLVEDLVGHTKEAHQRIVDAFRGECDGVWHDLVEDDYPRLYLTTHLDEAGEHQTLKNLLTEGNENIPWAEARYKKEETYAGYLNDLEHAWNIANRTDDFGLQIRCMLIENSIRSLANNIPPKLLAELAKSGMWSYPRCLATIKQMPNAHQQAQAIKLLIPNLPRTLLEQTLSTSREIKDEHARVCAFSALASHLTAELKPQLLVAAREIKDEHARVRAFSALASHLDAELKTQALSEALAAARKIKYEPFRARAFSEIAPHLTAELKMQVLSEALAAAREIKDKSTRARAFSEIAPYLNAELKTQVLSEALAAAHQIQRESVRAIVFSEIAPHINGELKPQMLAAARKIKDEPFRARAFSALAPHLTDELKLQLLADVREIKDESKRVRVLAALAPHLDTELKTQALSEALAAACEIQHEIDRAHVFSEIAPHINGELKPQMLAAACKIKDEHDRARAFSALAPHLTDELKLQLLSAAREIKAKSTRARVFSEIAPHLDATLKPQALSEALAAAREIQHEIDRANAVADLAPHLDAELKTQALSEALAATRQIKDESARARAFATLAPHLDAKLKPQLLVAAREIKDEHARVRVLAALAPHLGTELKPQLLVAAREIKDEHARVRVLAALAPHLDTELKTQVLSEALAAARQIKYGHDRARALAYLAPHLDTELKTQVLSEALAAARKIKDEHDRARAFSALAPHLTDELKMQVLSEALAAAREIKDKSTRARAFSEIAPHLTAELKPQLLVAAREIKDEHARAHAVADLAPHLDAELKTQVLSEAIAAACQIKDEFDRANAFFALAPHLGTELKPQLLAAAREIKDESDLVITGLAPHLDGELKTQALSEALAAARQIKYEPLRVLAITDLAPHLDAELKTQALSEAIAAARQIKNKSERAHAVAGLAPHLIGKKKIELLTEVLSEVKIYGVIKNIITEWSTVQYEGFKDVIFEFLRKKSSDDREAGVSNLIALTPALLHIEGEQIAGKILCAIRDTARWWS